MWNVNEGKNGVTELVGNIMQLGDRAQEEGRMIVKGETEGKRRRSNSGEEDGQKTPDKILSKKDERTVG